MSDSDERIDEQVTIDDVQAYCEQRITVAHERRGANIGWQAYEAAFEELAEFIATGDPPAERRR